MIKGLTHDEESGLSKMVVKYHGKISTGWAPQEGPNKKNAPAAAGFFRILKEITRTERVGSTAKTVAVKDWVLNETIQKALEKATKDERPRRIEIVSLYKTPQEMWESHLAMYSSSEGLLCKSHGKGENAKYLTFDPDGGRKWIDREFDGVKGCTYKECPDFISKKCKATGLLKCFPVINLTTNPYRFETRSINTILGIESGLEQLWNLLCVAHAVKEREAGKTLKFDGFFGAKLYMIHKKFKSGGNDIFITELVSTPDFISQVMEPIKRGLKFKAKQATLIGADGAASLLLEEAGQKLLESTPEGDDAVPLEIEDQKSIAKNFVADADSPETTENVSDADVAQEASATLLDKEED